MCAYRPVVPIFPSQSQGAGASSFPAFSTPSSLSLKRPFRHRRKDPSCDACRERKVKVHSSLYVLTCSAMQPPIIPVQNAEHETLNVNSQKNTCDASPL